MNEAVYHFMGLYRSPWLDTGMRDITSFGDGPVVLLILAWLIYQLYKIREYHIANSLVVVFLVLNLVVLALKLEVGEARPPVYADWGEGDVLSLPSFPSGHATNAAFIYCVLALLYDVNLLWPLSIAALVAVSRLYLGAHWLGDVLVGCCFGVSAAFTWWLISGLADDYSNYVNSDPDDWSYFDG